MFNIFLVHFVYNQPFRVSTKLLNPFPVYPRALSNLPMPTMWYILFFGMILLLGVSSQNAEMESMVTMLVDLRPKFFNANR